METATEATKETLSKKQKSKLKKKRKRQQQRRELAQQRELENSSTLNGINEAIEQEADNSAVPTKKRVIGVWPNGYPEDSQSTSSANAPSEPPSLTDSSQSSPSSTLNTQTHLNMNEEQSNTKKDNKEQILQLNTEFVRPLALQQEDEEEGGEETPRHRGLRCKKCFCLLARDMDFNYINGKLYILPQLRIPHFKNSTSENYKQSRGRMEWEGLQRKGNKIFCKNMHCVGFFEVSSFTNKSALNPVLTIHKTTFEDNFLKNPEFKDSPIIVNKNFAHIRNAIHLSNPLHSALQHNSDNDSDNEAQH